jgi:hypothetical protein
VKLLVGNKVDQERVISRQQAEEWAKARGMLFIEASAKTTEGVTQVFNEVAQQVLFKSYPHLPISFSRNIDRLFIYKQQILDNPDLLTNTRPNIGNRSRANLNAPEVKGGGCC